MWNRVAKKWNRSELQLGALRSAGEPFPQVRTLSAHLFQDPVPLKKPQAAAQGFVVFYLKAYFVSYSMRQLSTRSGYAVRVR